VATVVYRVRGRDTEDRRVVQRFRSTDAGRKEARGLVARLDGGSSLYDVRTRIAGRQVSKTFTRRRDADAWIASTEGDRMRGVAVDPRRGSVTVEDYARAWLAAGTIWPSGLPSCTPTCWTTTSCPISAP